MKWIEADFTDYLQQTLIPDLVDSGHEATATDFVAALRFIQGAGTVDLDDCEAFARELLAVRERGA